MAMLVDNIRVYDTHKNSQKTIGDRAGEVVAYFKRKGTSGTSQAILAGEKPIINAVKHIFTGPSAPAGAPATAPPPQAPPRPIPQVNTVRNGVETISPTPAQNIPEPSQTNQNVIGPAPQPSGVEVIRPGTSSYRMRGSNFTTRSGGGF